MITTTPTLEWHQAADPDGDVIVYNQVFIRDSSGTTVYDSGQISATTTRQVPSGSLEDGKTYSWKVRASDGVCWGDWSGEWSFIIGGWTHSSPIHYSPSTTDFVQVDNCTIITQGMSSDYGPRNVGSGATKFHPGIDIPVGKGTPVYAIADGTVTFVGGDYGIVQIQHDGFITRSLHLDSWNVNTNDPVNAGQQIGLSGGRGPDGPDHYAYHLHFDLGYQVYDNPLEKLKYTDSGIPSFLADDCTNDVQLDIQDKVDDNTDSSPNEKDSPTANESIICFGVSTGGDKDLNLLKVEVYNKNHILEDEFELDYDEVKTSDKISGETELNSGDPYHKFFKIYNGATGDCPPAADCQYIRDRADTRYPFYAVPGYTARDNEAEDYFLYIWDTTAYNEDAGYHRIKITACDVNNNCASNIQKIGVELFDWGYIGTAAPGNSIAYTLDVTNHDYMSGTITLEAKDLPSGWTTDWTENKKILSMSAGENRFVDFTITAASSGETASQGYVANIKVVATFDRIPDIKDSITTTTTVIAEDPDDTPGGANALPLDGWDNTQSVDHTSDFVDWWVISGSEITQDGFLTITLTDFKTTNQDFDLYVYDENDFYDELCYSNSGSGPTEECTISVLAGVSYYIKVYAHYGSGSYKIGNSFTPALSPPGSVSLRETHHTDHTLCVDWNEVDADYYNIEVTASPTETIKNIPRKVTSYCILDLPADTEVTLVISAVNDAGTSDSDPLVVTTDSEKGLPNINGDIVITVVEISEQWNAVISGTVADIEGVDESNPDFGMNITITKLDGTTVSTGSATITPINTTHATWTYTWIPDDSDFCKTFNANVKAFDGSEIDNVVVSPKLRKSPFECKKICIDSGHGGKDIGAPGVDGDGYPNEKDFNLDISLQLKTLLKDYSGVNPDNIIMTREDDTFVSLENRPKIANENKCDIFVSVHCNSAGGSNAHGTETLVYPYSGKEPDRYYLAENIQNELVRSIERYPRGMKKVNKSVLRNAKEYKIPAALAEVAFMSNQTEFDLLNTTSFRQKAAQGIKNGILQYFWNKDNLKIEIQGYATAESPFNISITVKDAFGNLTNTLNEKKLNRTNFKVYLTSFGELPTSSDEQTFAVTELDNGVYRFTIDPDTQLAGKLLDLYITLLDPCQPEGEQIIDTALAQQSVNYLGTQPPIANFTYTPLYPVVNQIMTFDASSSYDPDGGYITNYERDFGDGSITNTTNSIVTHSYASAGDYNVNLIVTDDDGAMNSTSKLIQVLPEGSVIYVPDDYVKIQWAVDNVSTGDTIIVSNGMYTENINVNKSLTIQSGYGATNCSVQAANSSDHVFEVTADYVDIIGFTVTGAMGAGKAGICLNDTVHCSILDNIVSNNNQGISLHSSSNNTLEANTVSHNIGGMDLDSSSNNTLEDNTVKYINCDGISLGFSTNNALSNNTVSHTHHGITLYHSNANTVANNTASNNSEQGIRLLGSRNNIASNNTAQNNRHDGILLWACAHNMVSNNDANSNGGSGIGISESSGNMLCNNTANSNIYGIALHRVSNENAVVNNNISNNSQYGIYLWCSGNNELKTNIVSDNSEYGIYLVKDMYGGSDNNLIYNNYFDNTNNAYDDGNNTNNIWNITKTNGTNIIDGPYLGGNYWGDYSGTDNNTDGIGDTHYPIHGGESIDHLPLIQPWSDTPQKGDLNRDGNVTPADAAIALTIAASGSASYDATTLATADVSGDDRVTSLDALMIMQAAAGTISL